MKVNVTHKNTKRLLNPANGYLSGYSHTLNPYSGCSYACSYCYVRKLPVALFRSEDWGEWVDVKQNAAERLRTELRNAKRKGAVSIFMSSSTDPYQPVESKEQITRSLLEVMTSEMPDFLFVQTRSPLATRDIDLFLTFQHRIRVSVTIETDLEEMRKRFTPQAPPLSARMDALQQLTDAGIPTQAAVAPVLPCSPQFGEKLSELTDRVCIDDYFMGDGSQGRRTKQLNIEAIYHQHGLEEWYDPAAYQIVLNQCKDVFSEEGILISQTGFLP